MTTRVPAEEIEVSRGEKVLVVMLAVFISVGAIWAYVRIDDIDAAPGTATPSERAAIDAREAANRARWRAQSEVRAKSDEVVRTREAYRTALDADRPAAGLERGYVNAQAALDAAERRLEAARAEVKRTAPGAEGVEASLDQERHSEQSRHDRQTFLLRLLLLAAMLGSSYYLLARLRRRRSRYLPATYAWIGASGVLALVRCHEPRRVGARHCAACGKA